MAVAKSSPGTPEYPIALIGIDPGVTTGVAVFLVQDKDTYPEDHRREQWEVWDEVAHDINGLAAGLTADGYNVVVIVEQWDKRPGVIDPDYTAKYINEMIDERVTKYPIVYQIPAVAKNLVKPPHRGGTDGLRRFGWYKTSFRHSNDAARHLAVYLVRTMKHLPTILRGWPRPDVY